MTTSRDTADFLGLYDAVTEDLMNFVATARSEGRLSNIEENWFQYIISGFRREFTAWTSPAHPEINTYLSLFDRGKASRPLRVAGHAFLHVGYDLPRVLADSIAKFAIARSRLRMLFVRPAPLFREMFLRKAREGTFGILARPLGFVRPMEVLAYWLLSLRSVAWIHAEILADSPPTLRQAQEQALAQALLEAGQKAKESKWVFGIPKLDNSQLFQIVPGTVLMPDPRLSASIIGVFLFALLTRLQNESIASRIAIIGQHFGVAAPKLLAETLSDGRIE